MVTIPTPTSLYLFDRTGNDTMGANNLTGTGTPTYVTGIFDYATSLNGTTQYFRPSGGSSVFDVTTGSLSIWGYFYTTTNGTLRWIVDKSSGSGTVGYSLWLTTTNTVHLFIRDGGGTIEFDTNTQVSTGRWYFFAAVWDRSGNGAIYLTDASTGTSETKTTSIAARSASITNAQTFTIGASSAGTGFFPGYIDHVNVLMGTVLTAQNVSDIYNTSRICIHKRDKTGGGNATVTYYEARNFNGVAIRGQNPTMVISDIVQTEKDAILTKVEGPTMQINVDWTITNEDSSVVFDNTNGSVTNGIATYLYLYNTLWPTGSNQIVTEYTLTLYNANDKSFVRTGIITGLDILQSADQPITFRATLQFDVGTV